MIPEGHNPYRRFGKYDLRHYLTHLEGAGRGADMHQVLSRESTHVERTPEVRSGLRKWIDRLRARDIVRVEVRRRNAWYAAHDENDGVEGFLADVHRCWRIAERESSKAASDGARQVTGLALEARYALIGSCVNNLAGNVPPAIIARSVDQGLLSRTQALAYARQTPDLSSRAASLAAVAPHLVEPARREALDQALATLDSIRDAGDKSRTLAVLAPLLAEPRQQQQALDCARSFVLPSERASALACLARHLSEPFQSAASEQAASDAENIKDEYDKVMVLVEIAALMSESDMSAVFARIISILETCSRGYRHAEVLAEVIHHVPAALFVRARALIDGLEDEDQRTTVSASLSARLAAAGDELGALRVIAEVSPIARGERRADALGRSAPYFSSRGFRLAMILAREVNVEHYRALALAGLIRHAPDEMVPEMAAAVRAIKAVEARGKALAAVASRLSETEREGVVREAAQAAIEHAESEQSRSASLIEVAPHASGPVLGLILGATRKIDDLKQQAITIAKLAAGLPPEFRRDVLRSILDRTQSIKSKTERAEASVVIAGELAQSGEQQQALALADSLDPQRYRARALAMVLPVIPSSDADDRLDRALTAWERAESDTEKSECLTVVAPHLPTGLLERALRTAQAIDWEAGRANVLVGLTPFAPERMLRGQIASEMARIGAPSYKHKLEAVFAIRLAELGSVDEALMFTYSMTNELPRMDALEGMIPLLDEDRLFRVLESVGEFTYHGRRHAVLAALASRFAELGHEMRARALVNEVRTINHRASAVARIARCTTGAFQSDAVEHALTLIKNMQGVMGSSEDRWQAQTIADVAPHARPNPLREAWMLALEIETASERHVALSALAVRLMELRCDDLYPLWSKASHRLARRNRANLLSDLAAVAPVIKAIGGHLALAETIVAVRDVGRWW